MLAIKIHLITTRDGRFIIIRAALTSGPVAGAARGHGGQVPAQVPAEDVGRSPDIPGTQDIILPKVYLAIYLVYSRMVLLGITQYNSVLV